MGRIDLKNTRTAIDKHKTIWYSKGVKATKAKIILKLLQERYPDATCELNFTTHYELLIAVILSAQCTDKRVNSVTKELFKVANTPTAMITLGQEALEKIIYSCGFYRQKAKNIISASLDILQQHDGVVPNTFDSLIGLAGVGRKTANVMMGVAFGSMDAIAVDTHVFRVSRRLGLASGDTPEKVEKELVQLFGDSGSIAHHLLIFHGRYGCKSQRPECEECVVQAYCTQFS